MGTPVSSSAFEGLDDDAVLSEVETVERLTAWLAARSVALVGELTRRREAAAVDELGADASGERQRLARVGAREAVVDEVALAAGLGMRVVRTRVDLACDPFRHGATCEALAAGKLSWSRVVQVCEKTAAVEPGAMRRVVDEVLAPWQVDRDGTARDEGGLAVPQAVFSYRLGRAVAAVTTTRRRQKAALDRRDVVAHVDPGEGSGAFVVTGHLARVAGATQRIESIARRLRREGDARTLAHLRSDIALDLLLHGELASSLPPEVAAGYATFAGALPPARVDVTVSAATLLGVSDQPGSLRVAGREEHVAAPLVRDLAYRAGSIWRRIVTDPATGYMADYSSTRYEVTGHLRERVFVRDHVSRVPGSMRPAQVCDTDHDVDFAEGGASSESNLSAKNRRGHNHKTHRRWRTDRGPDVHGRIMWTTGTGRTYDTTPFDHRDPATTGLGRGEQLWRTLRAHLRSAQDEAPVEAPVGASRGEGVRPRCDRCASLEQDGVQQHDPEPPPEDALPLVVHRPIGPRLPSGLVGTDDYAAEAGMGRTTVTHAAGQEPPPRGRGSGGSPWARRAQDIGPPPF